MVLLSQIRNNGDRSFSCALSVAHDDDLIDSTETPRFSEDLDSTCSTPYVSAPSSPGRGAPTGYFYSAPASPMHFMLSSAPSTTCKPSEPAAFLPDTSSSEFEFSSRFSTNGSIAVGSMSSADELFLNGQIRPMKLSTHLQRPQILVPLLDLEVEEDEDNDKNDDEFKQSDESVKRGRDLKLRSRSLHRKARSLSPLRSAEFQWHEEECNRERDVSEHSLELRDDEETKQSESTPSDSSSSSRSSSSGRNSKKWIFLKDLLYRSKSEGRGNGKEKFWSSISFSPSKERKLHPPPLTISREEKLSLSSDSNSSNTTDVKKQKPKQKLKEAKQVSGKKPAVGKLANGVAKRRVPPSAHELHYTANRAQAEEMKKRTFLPYRHGLFGCLGFSSKGYGALNGLARTLNPVSSRMVMVASTGVSSLVSLF
ncbi:uncharacterized protein LOC110819498 isoform X2 [Carica papaya]|uniref:uncharacterized protein LOC110819498 isoform X2 n=2 Tax=Carica papaya TaxID=3649 RepID=UPI000B8CCB77|nr:uncharacterized protein LOC110819498 isoform X2 [Carica papaya]